MTWSVMKRGLAAVALAAAGSLGLGAGAALAEYPEKPVTMVIPLGAGGSHDLNARVITSVIPEYLGNAVIVRLTPGAGGQKGTSEVANAAADGYTLLFTHNYIDMLQQHVENLPYDPLNDFVPIARVNFAPNAVVVRGDSEWETFDDFIQAAKDNPGGVRVSHSGNWGANFVPEVQIMGAKDVQFNLVPYQGGGPALQALLSGDVDMSMGFPSTLSGPLASGDIKLLATAGDERIYDDVPTFAEVGVPGDVGFMHRVVLAPAGTPEDVLEKLENAFMALNDDPTYNRLMTQLGENTEIIAGEEYQKMREAQSEEYEALVKKITGQ